MRRQRQRNHFDPFVAQRVDFLAARGPADVALRRFAVMDLTSLLGEGATDVLGVLEDLVDYIRKKLRT